MKKIYLTSCFLFLVSFSSIDVAYSQCAMCKAVAKSNMDSKQNQVGKGINKGVLYLLSIPYLLAGVGGIILYRNRKKAEA